MKKLLPVLAAIVILGMTAGSDSGNPPIKDEPETMTRLADHVVGLCVGAVSAGASIEGLTVTFEEDFTDPDDPVVKTNDAVKKCLRKISEGKVSPVSWSCRLWTAP